MKNRVAHDGPWTLSFQVITGGGGLANERIVAHVMLKVLKLIKPLCPSWPCPGTISPCCWSFFGKCSGWLLRCRALQCRHVASPGPWNPRTSSPWSQLESHIVQYPEAKTLSCENTKFCDNSIYISYIYIIYIYHIYIYIYHIYI